MQNDTNNIKSGRSTGLEFLTIQYRFGDTLYNPNVNKIGNHTNNKTHNCSWIHFQIVWMVKTTQWGNVILELKQSVS